MTNSSWYHGTRNVFLVLLGFHKQCHKFRHCERMICRLKQFVSLRCENKNEMPSGEQACSKQLLGVLCTVRVHTILQMVFIQPSKGAAKVNQPIQPLTSV